MKKKHRKYCPYCGEKISEKKEGDILREYCNICKIFFYDNPLPVVSCILENDRNIILVKRGNKPYKGMWCLPSGFAETGESIETAALRELKEETGVKAGITNLVDVDSCTNYFYGDLIFLTFEVERTGGKLIAGDDAVEVKYFPLNKIPKLAFDSNTKAVNAYIKSKVDYWAIVDSFNLTIEDVKYAEKKKNLLSDRLIDVIENNSELIATLWLKDVTTKKSTYHYQKYEQKDIFERGKKIILQFGKWLEGFINEKDIRNFYFQLGEERKTEGFALSEVMSALILIRKNIWEFALSKGMWQKTIDIYMALELERRMMLFFDRASFYIIRGFETGKKA
ncbi:MAG: NUDIX hydrolase [Bacteroidales bacterium]|nr:NUDIX hydrolase [Bacteroidales bacterium]